MRKILTVSRKWNSNNLLVHGRFEESLAYFRARYIENGQPTEQYQALRLRNTDRPELVFAVLKGENNDAADLVAALLIVVFRLRNNLFYGNKWAYGIQGQRDNFVHANIVLMKVLEIHERL